MIQTRCRHFNGYKPCGKNDDCTSNCPSVDLIESSVLVIHLGALGAVVRSTALLPLIHRKYPKAHLTWVTDRPADQLLRGHALIDRVMTASVDDVLQLTALKFDVAFVIDKSLKAVGLLHQTEAREVFGFVSEPKTGAILPATSSAEELWQIGLSNQKKFFENQKSEILLISEALELSQGVTPDYHLPLTGVEKAAAESRREQWKIQREQPLIGINTGCSSVIAAKKLSVPYQREMIRELLNRGFENLVLLGGPEDSERNRQIGQGLPVFQSATERGLRDGLVSVAACDFVVTGDSLGMHMAISQKKFVVAWFGPTCAQEIELYGRGVAIRSPVTCGPCWKRTCDKSQMCYDEVRLSDILEAIERENQNWRRQNAFLSSKPLS